MICTISYYALFISDHLNFFYYSDTEIREVSSVVMTILSISI
jgi:hypothetical protein